MTDTAAAATAMRRGADLRTRRLRRTTRLVLGVAGVPSAALLTLGVIVMVTGSAARDVVFGVLIIGMAATVATGVVVTSILLAREAELARLQSEFLSRVSHDLRTPLTSIRMFVETLQLGRAQDPDTTRECLETLANETDRLLAMVDRLLEWARIESARRVYTPHRANVKDIVDKALDSLEALRLQRAATIDRNVPETIPDVEVDAQAITDALVNLLQNAWHYTPDEDKRIGVTVRLDGDQVLIAVSDNGPGVTPSERSKIFERFYRGAAAKARRVAGTGLGLAMVRAVVAAHGGEVRVDANPGGGSVFTMALPIAESPR
jgi:two-component system phosphate regulon sensor histidine kinase PhoR